MLGAPAGAVMCRLSADNWVDLSVNHPSALVSADVKQPWLIVLAQLDLKQTGAVLYPWSCPLYQWTHGRKRGWSLYRGQVSGLGLNDPRFSLRPKVPVDVPEHGIAGLLDLFPDFPSRLTEKHPRL